MMVSDFNSAVGATTTSFTHQISDWMISAGLSEDIAGTITGLVDKIYDVIDLSAIQVCSLFHPPFMRRQGLRELPLGKNSGKLLFRL